MERRYQSAMGARERRTQEARIAALFARPRTCYRAAQCVLGAGALFFSSLLMLQMNRCAEASGLGARAGGPPIKRCFGDRPIAESSGATTWLRQQDESRGYGHRCGGS